MTADIPLTEKEKVVYTKLMCSGKGMSIKAVSRETGIPVTTTYNIVDRLLRKGVIVECFQDRDGVRYPYNPRMFGFPDDDPHRGSNGTPDEETVPYEGFIEPSSSIGTLLDVVENGLPDTHGLAVSTAKDCPPGYCRGHIAGHIQYAVQIKGDDTIRTEADGVTVGYLGSEVKPNGNRGLQRTGVLNLFNQEMTFTYRWFPTTGNAILLLKPASLYFNPVYIKDVDQLRGYFMDRARIVMKLLCQPQNGWVLSEPAIHGKVHMAFINHPLIPFLSKDTEDEDADLKVDRSTGENELEIEHDGPDAAWKSRITKDFPTIVKGLLDCSKDNSDSITALADHAMRSDGSMAAIADHVTRTQDHIADLAGHVARTQDSISVLSGLAASSSDAIAKLSERIAQLEQINALQQKANRLQDEHIDLLTSAVVSQQKFSETLATQLTDFRDKCMDILTANQQILSMLTKSVADFGTVQTQTYDVFSSTMVRQNKVVQQLIDQTNLIIKLNAKQLQASSVDRPSTELRRIEDELRAQQSLDRYQVPGRDGGGGVSGDQDDADRRTWEGYQ